MSLCRLCVSGSQDFDLRISCAFGIYEHEKRPLDLLSFNNYRKPHDVFCNAVMFNTIEKEQVCMEIEIAQNKKQ